MRIGLSKNMLLFNTDIIYITGLLIFEKPNYDKIFVAIIALFTCMLNRVQD